MRRGSVVFTGLPRTPERLRRSVQEMGQLRRRGIVGEIVFATWAGEVDDDVRHLLRAHAVALVEGAPPPDPGPGNVWNQMRALEVGLDHVPTDALVLKTRTDLHVHPALIERMFTDADFLAIGADDANRPLEQRVWVPWFEITKPFYLADECFCGTYRDLRRLVNYDPSYDPLWSLDAGMTHVRRFIHPFRGQEPLFEEYLERGTDLGFGPQRFETLYRRLADPWFRRVLAAYYDCLQRCFRIDSATQASAVTFREWSRPHVTIDPARFRENFTPACSWRPASGHIYAYDGRWLENIAAGAFGDLAAADCPAWGAEPAGVAL